MEEKKGRSVFDTRNRPTDMTFLMLPKDLEPYFHIPSFKSDMAVLYGYLADYYNADYGYAFPSIPTLALKMGKSTKTIETYLKGLEQVDLVKVIRRKGGNNKYIPMLPLSTDEVFRRYPEARECYERKQKALKVEEERSKINPATYLNERKNK